MKKHEFFHLHQLVYEAAQYELERQDRDEDPEDIFTDYDELEVGPQRWNVSKKDHREALETLLDSFTGFIEDDEETLKTLGERYREEGLNRRQAAEEVAEFVDYAPRTVYDKFSDVGVEFSQEHDPDTRQEALDMLYQLSDSGEERQDALEEASEETGVPEGTLITWMSDEGIKFDSHLAAVVPDQSKRELVETAEHYFDTRHNMETMEQALGRGSDTLRAYKQGRIDTMPLELLDRLDALFESEPRYRLDDPERYVEDETWRGVKVEDDFQEYLFQHLTTEEFKGMTGKSQGSFNKYRQNKTESIDREAYRKAFQAVSHMYQKHPEPEIDALVDKNRYGTNAGSIERSRLDPEEVPENYRLDLGKLVDDTGLTQAAGD